MSPINFQVWKKESSTESKHTDPFSCTRLSYIFVSENLSLYAAGDGWLKLIIA